MSFLRNVNPTGAVTEFASVFRDAGPARWGYAALAALCTVGIFGTLTLTQNWIGERRLPEITYINSWPADRTEAETKAFIAANQKKKEAREKAQADADAEAQRLWMVVGRASGMDVDAIKKKADAEKAAAKAKQDAADRAAASLAAAKAQAPVAH
ncbi:MAG: hypothetical protein QFC78_01270 [Pseudomonadota bacterium]|nr:hypothetical protein [Pseudomonadota bacterium]